jgi:hypothetical protein
MAHSLTFEIGASAHGATVIVPRIDGQSLIDLITAYEAVRKFDVVGGYGGLIPESFNYGPLERYFFEGWVERKPDTLPWLWLLGCECGEVGCWPLSCTVEARDDVVIWRDFGNEHRPERDYAGFGPFAFERAAYERVLQDLPKPA